MTTGLIKVTPTILIIKWTWEKFNHPTRKICKSFYVIKILTYFLSTLIKRIINDCLRTIGLHIPLFLGKIKERVGLKDLMARQRVLARLPNGWVRRWFLWFEIYTVASSLKRISYKMNTFLSNWKNNLNRLCILYNKYNILLP